MVKPQLEIELNLKEWNGPHWICAKLQWRKLEKEH